MNYHVKNSMLMFFLLLPLQAQFGCGCCAPFVDDIVDAQRVAYDEAAEQRYKKKRQAAQTQREEMERLRQSNRKNALVEQQKAHDAALAQYLAEQELDNQRRRDVLESQRIADEFERRARQERRDRELAQKLAEQEYENQRRLNQIALQEQHYAREVAAKKAAQEREDAALARRLAQEEYNREQARIRAEQDRLYDEVARKERQVREDEKLALALARQEIEKNDQVARDADLARRLQEEELRAFAATSGATPKTSNSRSTVTTPVIQGIVKTTNVPGAAHAMQAWINSNDVLPKVIPADDSLCVVCMSSMHDLQGTKMIRFNCKHVFCPPCIKGLIAHKQGLVPCPTCRASNDVATLKRLVQ